jgi:hypothetical protein
VTSSSPHDSLQDRAGTPIGASVLVAFVTARDRAAAEESWRSHLTGADAPRAAAGSALFAVLEGEGDYVLFHESAEGRVDDAQQSILKHFGADNVLSFARFERVFAADDARPLSSVSGFLFLARAAVDPAIDHQAFNEWYDGVHVPDVGAAGLGGAQRFRGSEDGDDYLASYEIASPAVLESPELSRVRGFHHFTPSIRQLRRTIGEFVAGGSE